MLTFQLIPHPLAIYLDKSAVLGANTYELCDPPVGLSWPTLI
jgi:hypothetical protein